MATSTKSTTKTTRRTRNAGRTDSALPARTATSGAVRTFIDIPLTDLHPDPRNQRDDYGDLQSLADSISKVGLLTPLRVKPRAEGGYTIVFGERRYLALGLARIDAATCEVTDDACLARDVDRITENLHRKDLTPIEQARELASLRDDHGFTTERQIAEAVGLSQPTVHRLLSVLSLPDDALAALINGKITFTEGVELARIKDPERIKKAMRAGTGYIVNAAARAAQTEADEKKVAKTVAGLKRSGVALVDYPQWNSWIDRPEKPLGTNPGQVNLTVDDHETEPCHAAAVSSSAHVVYVCTDPARHVPAQGKKHPVGKPAATPLQAEGRTDVQAPPVPEEETPEQRADREEREAEQARQEEKTQAFADAARARTEFTRTLLDGGKAPHGAVAEHVARTLIERFIDWWSDTKQATDLLGLGDLDDPDAALRDYTQTSKANLWRAALAVTFALAENAFPQGLYAWEEQTLEADQRRYLDFITTLGYQPSPIEQELLAPPPEDPTLDEAGDGATQTGDERPDEASPTEDEPSEAGASEDESSENDSSGAQAPEQQAKRKSRRRPQKPKSPRGKRGTSDTPAVKAA